MGSIILAVRDSAEPAPRLGDERGSEHLLGASFHVGLLHVYSKQSQRQSNPIDLSSKAIRSRRPSAREAAVKRRARQLRPDEVDALIAHSRENGRVVTAGERTRITRQTAAKRLATAGVETTRRKTDTDIAAAVRAYDDGQQSAARMGRRLGFGVQTMLMTLRRAGVQIRPRPGRPTEGDRVM